MYSVNGIALDNEGKSWVLRAPTKPLSQIVTERASVRSPGTDGVAAGIGGFADPVTLPFMVRTPKTNLEALVALFMPGGVLSVTGDASRQVLFEFLSFSYTGYGAADADVDAQFLIRLPEVWWRSASTSTSSAASISSGSVDVSGFFSGMSAPVQDAIIRVKGRVGGLIVSDHGGAWFSLDDILDTGEYLRFESATGRGFITTSDAWVGGTEVSDRIDYGGPRGVFELTPYWASDPATRSGKLKVSTLSRSGTPTIEVRGKAAFLT